MTHSTPVAVKRHLISRQVSLGRLMPLLLSAFALVAAVPGRMGVQRHHYIFIRDP